MSALIAGAIVGGSTIVSSIINAYSANQAAQTQADAAAAGIEVTKETSQAALDEVKRQYDAMQAILKPYTEAGTQSLKATQDLAGLNGPEAQSAAIKGISSSPEMLAMTQQGENAILQQGAATGGLRGGNTAGALAQFRPQMLSDLINKQYGRLGGITQMGQASAAGVGAAGMQTGANVAGILGQQGAQVANLLGQQGAATAGGQLAAGQAWSQPFNLAAQMAGLYGLNQMGVF
jgi:hypothetical protein